METADVAMNDHVMNARITESSYWPHDSSGYILQKWTSLSKRMVTPADAEAAANERIAVTCIQANIIVSLKICFVKQR
jgi:hypothetical protein